MIRKPTVLILGAGASVPYGFPTGPGLIKEIIESSSRENGPFRVALRRAGAQEDDIAGLAMALSATQFDSIDVFLEHRPQFREVGKLAIAAALIPREDPASLQRPPGFDGHWYQRLFTQLIGSDGFQGSLLTVITLNYDRSLEQYLFETVKREFQLTDAEAASKVLAITIVHVHGLLGDVNWRPPGVGEQNLRFTRAYSVDRGPENIQAAAKEIRIASDLGDERLAGHARAKLLGAEYVGFLGFGYHEATLDRLGIRQLAQRAEAGSVKVYCSAYKLAHGKVSEIQGMIPDVTVGHDTQDCLAFVEQSGLIYQGLASS